MLNEPSAHRLGALLAQELIVIGRAAVVGVALNFDPFDFGMPDERVGDLRQDPKRFRQDHRAIQGELNLLADGDFLGGDLNLWLLGLRPHSQIGRGLLAGLDVCRHDQHEVAVGRHADLGRPWRDAFEAGASRGVSVDPELFALRVGENNWNRPQRLTRFGVAQVTDDRADSR